MLTPAAPPHWIHIKDGPASADLLDVDCGVGAAGEDLGATGSKTELLSITDCFYGKWRRLIGYGAPIIVIVTRSVGGRNRLGCSLGPLTDYVTIEGGIPSASHMKSAMPATSGTSTALRT